LLKKKDLKGAKNHRRKKNLGAGRVKDPQKKKVRETLRRGKEQGKRRGGSAS